MSNGNLISDAAAVAVRNAEVRPLAGAPQESGRISPQLALAAGGLRTPELQLSDFSADQLRDVATAFGDVVSLVNRDLRILVDESTGRIVTQIVDGETNEVVRQLPPEALLDVARRVADLVGLLLDEER